MDGSLLQVVDCGGLLAEGVKKREMRSCLPLEGGRFPALEGFNLGDFDVFDGMIVDRDGWGSWN